MSGRCWTARSVLHGVGVGFKIVEEKVLIPLEGVKPNLSKEFLRQYKGALQYRVNGRNWMQAYSIWYAREHNRFH